MMGYLKEDWLYQEKNSDSVTNRRRSEAETKHVHGQPWFSYVILGLFGVY